MLANRPILCPVDFSERSMAAARQAAAMARAQGTELLLVHVAKTPLLSHAENAGYTPALAQRHDALLRERLQTAADSLRALTTVRPLLVRGAVDAGIAGVAAQNDADSIVMAARGRRGLARVLGDRMRERVARRAGVRVVGISPAHGRPAGLRHSVPFGLG